MTRIHVIPVGGLETLHAAQPSCDCQPLVMGCGLVVHNARDGREQWERQGITDPAKHWVLVMERTT